MLKKKTIQFVWRLCRDLKVGLLKSLILCAQMVKDVASLREQVIQV
jgi:hypothetical protein